MRIRRPAYVEDEGKSGMSRTRFFRRKRSAIAPFTARTRKDIP
jgi:hypothetical protein